MKAHASADAKPWTLTTALASRTGHQAIGLARSDADGRCGGSDRLQIAAYLGASSRFEEAIASFAEDYADPRRRTIRCWSSAAGLGAFRRCSGDNPETGRASAKARDHV
jgi:hypothetical protein